MFLRWCTKKWSNLHFCKLYIHTFFSSNGIHMTSLELIYPYIFFFKWLTFCIFKMVHEKLIEPRFCANFRTSHFLWNDIYRTSPRLISLKWSTFYIFEMICKKSIEPPFCVNLMTVTFLSEWCSYFFRAKMLRMVDILYFKMVNKNPNETSKLCKLYYHYYFMKWHSYDFSRAKLLEMVDILYFLDGE